MPPLKSDRAPFWTLSLFSLSFLLSSETASDLSWGFTCGLESS
jgi:hypothetical protein